MNEKTRPVNRTSGNSYPLGATVFPEGVNFCLYSKTGLAVELLFFDDVEDANPARLIHLHQHDTASFMWNCVLPRRGPDWAAKVSSYLASTPCCRQRGWEGMDGMVRFWVHYKGICEDLFLRLSMPTLSIENSAQDWAAIYDQIASWLSDPRPEVGVS